MITPLKCLRTLPYPRFVLQGPAHPALQSPILFENAEPFIRHAEKHGSRYCVAMLDIDHFKNVNDTHGHDAGDEVLKSVSALIAQGFSEKAIVTRFGGEEFCVLVAHDEKDDILDTFEAVRSAVEILP